MEKDKYVLVRTKTAGVFAGYIKERKVTKAGVEAVLTKVRRIWYWDGAASLSQLAVDGVSKPENCKFPVEVPTIEVSEVIEILDISEKAKKSIASVPVWAF